MAWQDGCRVRRFTEAWDYLKMVLRHNVPSLLAYLIKANFRRNHYGNLFGLGFAQPKQVAIVISAIGLDYKLSIPNL